MTEPKRGKLAISGENTLAREKLRQRILEIVDRKLELTDVEVWQESGPNYLPWKPMIEEIKALDAEKKLRLEIIKPGHWIIHSLQGPPAATKPAAKTTSKSAKRSSSKSKKTKA